VCLDEAGNYGAAFSIDHGISRVAATNGRYAFAVDEHIATHDGVRGIHRDERAVLNED
jgi:hypothetical protein